MEFLVVGNITKDIIRSRSGDNHSFGGTSYSGIAAARLGCKSKILSSGNSELSGWIDKLASDGVKVELQEDKNSTLFVNDYTHGDRMQTLMSNTAKIELHTNVKSDVIHINPMLGEVDSELVKKARKLCDVLSLDVQGFVRSQKSGRVVGKFFDEREEILPHVDFLKVGSNEIGSVSRLKDFESVCEELHSLGAKTVALTFGADGSLVYDGELHRVAAFRTNVVDETGAGDVYGTAFATRYFDTNDVVDSAVFASAAASFVVEDIGPRSIAEREDVLKRYATLKKRLA